MRSLELTDINNGAFPTQLLLLDTSVLGECYVAQLLAHSPLNIRTRRSNLHLPPELWSMILYHMHNHASRTPLSFTFVKAAPIPWPGQPRRPSSSGVWSTDSTSTPRSTSSQAASPPKTKSTLSRPVSPLAHWLERQSHRTVPRQRAHPLGARPLRAKAHV